MRIRHFGVSIVTACVVASTAAALEPAEVLVLVNRDVPASSRVANFYVQARNVPTANVLRLGLGAETAITRDEYRTRIVPAVKKRLQDDPKIRCLLTTSGFPYTIRPTSGKEDGAAVDNELAAVLRDEPADLNHWQPNPLYLRGENANGATDPRAFQMVYVARLEGPGFDVISRMVTDAIATEKSGLQGPVFGDTRGLDGYVNSAAADASIRGAMDRLAGAGFHSTLDMNPETWKAPAGGVGDQAAGAAFYIGWYSLQTFQDVFGRQGLARGAIAWHIASDEAISPWSATTTEWCPNLLRRGAAVTIGAAFEPYLAAFPKGEILVEQLLAGRSVAESYWLALPHVSWAMVLLGDPLYRPFAQPRPSLVSRAYTAAAPGRVLRAGETAPLLVRLQCVGPAGSGTPAMVATTSAGPGLTAASGKVQIPALQAGEAAIVSVPGVTAGKDPTGMFRAQLKVETRGEENRTIVVEGRTGLSLVAGSAGRYWEMFPSPKGWFVVGGQPNNAAIIETGTLDTRPAGAPAGWGLVGGAFSPDETHLILTYIQPQQKQMLSVIADRGARSPKYLPAGTQFLRWQSNDEVLLKGASGILKYSIPLAASLPIAAASGWEVAMAVAGSDAVVLRNAEGRWALRRGAAPQRPILEGVRLTRDTAVANDLSLFGGVDAENRFWVQRGVDARPAIAAENVGRVFWGPISRRVAVQSMNGDTRIYDGSDEHWSPLGSVLLGVWSGDEKRFLFITGSRTGNGTTPDSLSLWDDGKIVPLCPMDRIGDLGGMALTQNGDTAFLLAGPESRLAIWALGLPAAKPADANAPARAR